MFEDCVEIKCSDHDLDDKNYKQKSITLKSVTEKNLTFSTTISSRPKRDVLTESPLPSIKDRSHLVGSMITYECNDGHEYANYEDKDIVVTATCNIDAEWNLLPKQIPKCIPIFRAGPYVGVFVSVLLVAVLVGYGVYYYKNIYIPPVKLIDITKMVEPGQFRIIPKNDQITTTIQTYAADTAAHKKEYKVILDVAKKIEDKLTVREAENNKDKNRYRNIRPFDNNIVKLREKIGDPRTDYLNASYVRFPNNNQVYIASQAPKENSFEHFWLMMLQQRVSIIVMITKLMEGHDPLAMKPKAEQYWPDDGTTKFFPDTGLKVECMRQSYKGTYFWRKFVVTQGEDTAGTIIQQLQCDTWPDMTAPDDSKILLDLLNESKDIQKETTSGLNNRPILVHCSAGVGRTGTFIGLHKLVGDYEDENQKELDVGTTVLQMRSCRTLMVQKQEQYNYLFLCLGDYVAHSVAEYSY